MGTEKVSGGLQSEERLHSFLKQLDEALRAHNLPSSTFVVGNVGTTLAGRDFGADRARRLTAAATERMGTLLKRYYTDDVVATGGESAERHGRRQRRPWPLRRGGRCASELGVPGTAPRTGLAVPKGSARGRCPQRAVAQVARAGQTRPRVRGSSQRSAAVAGRYGQSLRLNGSERLGRPGAPLQSCCAVPGRRGLRAVAPQENCPALHARVQPRRPQ